MKHKGKFQKVNAAAKRMYGPKVLLVCGYPQDEHEPFLSFLQKTKIADFPVVFAVQTDLERQVREIIDQDHKSGFMHSSPMPNIVFLALIIREIFPDHFPGSGSINRLKKSPAYDRGALI
ncbi:MAG: hypothetical protein R6U55_12020, partial [Desulfovermiculus sp.]